MTLSADQAARAMVSGEIPVPTEQEPPQPQLAWGEPQAAPPQPVTGSAVPVNYGNAPVGTRTLTAPQSDVATLGNKEEQKDIAATEGTIGSSSEAEQARILRIDAAEKAQRTADYNKFLQQATADHEALRAQSQADHKAWLQARGDKTNPQKEFWKDKTSGAHVLSGLAAFASGMGAGLLGQVGNPYLDHLNKIVTQNWEAHRQDVDDLFKRQVESGKIADTDASYRDFMDKAKMHASELGEEHIKSELERVKHGALGENYKVLADKTINGIDQQQIDRRAAAGARDAAALAAAAQARRAQEEKVRGAYKDAYEHNLSAGYGEEESRIAAAKAVQGMGFDRSILAPVMESNGGAYNPKSGQFEFQEAPKPEGGSALIPDKDPVTGKPIKPEARAQLEQQVVRDVNGVERLVRNKEEVKPVNNQLEAIRDFKKELPRLKELQDKWESGKLDGAKEISEYEAIVGRMIPIYNSLAGSDRATPGGEVEHVLRTSVMPVTPGTTIKLGEHEANIAKLGVPGSSTGYFQKQAAKESRARIEGLEGRVKQVEKDVDARLKPVAGSAASKPDEQAAEGAPAYVPKSFQKK